MENNPVAPTPAETPAEASVATPISANSEPSADTTAPTASVPEIGAEQVAKYLGTDVDTLEKFTTFTKNNGQFDGAFKRMKEAISRPQPQPEAPQAPQQPQVAPTPTQAPEAPQNAPQSVREGSLSIEELTVANYFDKLAGEEKYAPIADEIRNGKVLEGLKNFNITPVSDGRINDADVRRYLDLYTATKPAVQTSTAPEQTSRVEYYNVPDEKAMTYEQATQIQMQNVRLKAAGQPLHPLTDRANEVVNAKLFAAKK